MKRLLLAYLFLFITSTVSAQLYEMGVFAGGSNYIGDIGPTTYINPNFPAAGGILKFNYTPRINFRGTLIATELRSTDLKSNSSFRVERGYVVRRRLLDVAGGVEFNFFKYSMNKVGYSQTPYIIAQAAIASYRAFEKDSNGFATQKIKFAVFPSLGLGYKMRLAENFAGSFETSFRYVYSDDIDETSDNNRNIGNTNSDDWYVFTGITLTYGFGRPGCYKKFF